MVGFGWIWLDWVGLGWTESDLSDRWDGSDTVGRVDHSRAHRSGAEFVSVFIGLNFGADVFV